MRWRQPRSSLRSYDLEDLHTFFCFPKGQPVGIIGRLAKPRQPLSDSIVKAGQLLLFTGPAGDRRLSGPQSMTELCVSVQLAWKCLEVACDPRGRKPVLLSYA